MWKIISAVCGALFIAALLMVGYQAHKLELAAHTLTTYRQLEEARKVEVSVCGELVRLSREIDARCETRLGAYHATLEHLMGRLGLDDVEFQSPLSVHLEAIGGGDLMRSGPDLVQGSKINLIRKKVRAERQLQQCREKTRGP